MADLSTKIDAEKVIAFSNDLVECLKNRKDEHSLTQLLEQEQALRSHCDKDYDTIHDLLQENEKKIDVCKKREDEARSAIASDIELDLLQQELEVELEKENLLREELRAIGNEIDDLEHQRVSIEERRKDLKKLEQDKPRAEMKLSMYASVTNLIPDTRDHSKISGYIVQRDKKVVEKFEFDPSEATSFETTNSIWEMINKQY